MLFVMDRAALEQRRCSSCASRIQLLLDCLGWTLLCVRPSMMHRPYM